MTDSTERLLLRFMLMMTRVVVILASARLEKGAFRELVDLKRDLSEATYPNATYSEAYK